MHLQGVGACTVLLGRAPKDDDAAMYTAVHTNFGIPISADVELQNTSGRCKGPLTKDRELGVCMPAVFVTRNMLRSTRFAVHLSSHCNHGSFRYTTHTRAYANCTGALNN